jgi:hypothetical protein
MKMRFLALASILMTTLACSAQSAGVTGEWRGIWTNPAGSVFTAQMTLDAGPGCKTCAVLGSGSIRGKIVWTLRKAGPNAPPELAAQVGATATELVKGDMKGEGLLVLNGYESEDPNHIRPADQYRLALSDNGKVVGGITLNGGSWTGQFIAVRSQP